MQWKSSFLENNISRAERVVEGLDVVALFHDSSWVYPDFFPVEGTLRVFRAQASSSGVVAATETPITERPDRPDSCDLLHSHKPHNSPS